LKIINRELLKQFIDKSNSEYISEISIHTLFMRYGQEHFNDKGEYKDELESSARTESETS
jgi:hypothetical protein